MVSYSQSQNASGENASMWLSMDEVERVIRGNRPITLGFHAHIPCASPASMARRCLRGANLAKTSWLLSTSETAGDVSKTHDSRAARACPLSLSRGSPRVPVHRRGGTPVEWRRGYPLEPLQAVPSPGVFRLTPVYILG
jgi:hypothetical protein